MLFKSALSQMSFALSNSSIKIIAPCVISLVRKSYGASTMVLFIEKTYP